MNKKDVCMKIICIKAPKSLVPLLKIIFKKNYIEFK